MLLKVLRSDAESRKVMLQSSVAKDMRDLSESNILFGAALPYIVGSGYLPSSFQSQMSPRKKSDLFGVHHQAAHDCVSRHRTCYACMKTPTC